MSISRILAAWLLVLFAGSGCTRLIYHPTEYMYYPHPEKLDGIREEVTFAASDGTKLAGWFLKARQGGHRGAIVQFHGNAENMTSHFASLLWVIDEGYDLFVFDYRGYGISEGKPNPEGVNQDALAAIRYLLARESASEDGDHGLVLYGQSLGGAILLRAFDDVTPEERHHVRAVVIESSFYDYHAIARDLLSRSFITFLFQPLAYVLISDSYSPEESIPRVSPTPLLVLHGDKDRIVPAKFGQKIYDLAKEPKQFWLIPDAGHIQCLAVDGGRERPRFLEYLKSLP